MARVLFSREVSRGQKRSAVARKLAHLLPSHRPITALVIAISILRCLSPASAGIVYVDAGATGAENGSSWCDAYHHLQDAIFAAASSSGGVNEIRVAQGVYRPDGGAAQTLGNRLATFSLIDGVALVGGYAGCGAADPDARDFVLYETILSGDLNGDDGPNFANIADNSIHIVTYSNPNAVNVVLDGFTVTGGNADGTEAPSNQGSAVNIRNGVVKCIPGGPTLRNCIFRNNWSLHHGAVNDHGLASVIEDCTFRDNYSGEAGAGLLIHSGSASVRRCVFENNVTAGNGGGAWTSHDSDPSCAAASEPSFHDCVFKANRAFLGAGLYNELNTVQLDNCSFEENFIQAAGGGGAGVYCLQSNVEITECAFRGNQCACSGAMDGVFGGGAALYAKLSTISMADSVVEDNEGGTYGGGLFVGDSSMTIVRTQFIDNYGGYGGAMSVRLRDTDVLGVRESHFQENIATTGAGMYIAGGVVQIEQTDFVNNIAGHRAGAIGVFGDLVYANRCRFVGNRALSGGGALHTGSAADFATFTNCLFAHNSSPVEGGAVHNVVGSPLFTNCTFAKNSAGTTAGGVWIHSGNPTLQNCVLWDNEDSSGSGELAQLYLLADPPQDWIEPGSVSVRSSCVRGWSGTLPGPNNIGDDPLFFDPDGTDGVPGTLDDDWSLASASQAIDTGEPPAVTEPLDLFGNPRVVGSAIDMGAFEYHCQPGLFADLDDSGVVELADVLCLLSGYLLRTNCASGDIWPCPRGDGLIELGDLLALLAAFAGDPPCDGC